MIARVAVSEGERETGMDVVTRTTDGEESEESVTGSRHGSETSSKSSAN